MWWCRFIDLLKLETRPSSLLNFGTANFNWEAKKLGRQIVAVKLAQITNLSEINSVTCKILVFRDSIPVLPCVFMLTTRSRQ